MLARWSRGATTDISRQTRKPRILQRPWRQRLFPARPSSWLNLDRYDAAGHQERLTESRQNRPLSLPPTNGVALATMEAQEEHIRAAIIRPQDYRNAYEGPDHIMFHHTVDAQKPQCKVITAFGDEMYDVSSSRIRTGEELWTDFIFTFCPHSLLTCLKVLTWNWCQYLRSRGIHGDSGRKTLRAEDLTRLLFREAHILARRSTGGRGSEPR